ncbi:RNA polymerase sigma factor [Parapedobacter tibetensis]|uniref:RNA polymerase sigma factor n=1 Tax=Parapedobacter tibetensis TaxID=2972951 RepID=UPI00214D98F9|nr:RNA polymerase sigma-70 factor [Parapedobacter tibetensis]
MALPNAFEEKDLLHRLQDGDQVAYDSLFRQFHPALCFFARRLVNEPRIAEEIVLDTMLKLWHRCDNFDSVSSIKAFLYIATKNACFNHIEKERVRTAHQNQFLGDFKDTEDAVVTEIIYAEVLREVSEVIDTLPEQCRKVIKMIYEEGLSANEISKTLGVTVSTVNNQKSRGISLLKKRLSGSGFGHFLIFI